MMQLLDFFMKNDLALFSYGFMVFVTVETFSHAWSSQRVLSKMRRLHAAFQKEKRGANHLNGWVGCGQIQPIEGLQTEMRGLLRNDTRRALYAMGRIELVAPVLGLGLTLLAFLLAIPGLVEALKVNPDALFNKFGIGAGTSIFGIVCLVVAVIQRLRLQEWSEHLDDDINECVELAPCDQELSAPFIEAAE